MDEVNKYDIYDEVLTVGDVARLLNVDRQAVQKWVTDGKLEASRMTNGKLKIMRSDLDRAMRKVNGDNWP